MNDTAFRARQGLVQAKRIVVKVGSQLLADDASAFTSIGAQIVRLVKGGYEPLLVTSGAIALGYPLIGCAQRPKDLPSLQAAAACGQGLLLARWSEALREAERPIAQILLTHADLASRTRYLNARSAFMRLLRLKTLPLINENDTVSVEEIQLGDNDLLAAEVCGLVSADLVVLLTGANGFMDADPKVHAEAQRISFIDEIDNDIRAAVGRPSALGTGGMGTKLRAAEIARKHGAATVIAPGKDPDILEKILRGEDVGTLVAPPTVTPQKARKRWIGHTLKAQGSLFIDPGAERALRGQASLLFAGVQRVEGTFLPGDCVEIVSLQTEKVIGRGLVTLSSSDAQKVVGLRSEVAAQKLDVPLPDEMVHRDNLVWLGGEVTPLGSVEVDEANG